MNTLAAEPPFRAWKRRRPNPAPSRPLSALRGLLCLFAALSALFSFPALPARAEALDPSTNAALNPLLTAEEQSWLQKHPVVGIRISATYPPFEFKKDDRYQGMAVDYLELVSKRLGIEFRPVEGLTWKQSLDSLRQKDGVDAVLMITRDKERESFVTFTADYLSFPEVIITRKDGRFVGEMRDLSGLAIATENGFIESEWLRRDIPSVRISEFDTTDEALEAVATGKADAYLGNLAVATYLIERAGFTDLKVASPSAYPDDAYAMGVRKDWPELAAMLDKALASVTPAEQLEIRQKWLTLRYEHGLRWQDIVAWVLGTALLGLVFIVWLRVMVRRRTADLNDEMARRLRSEESLRESERNYRLLVESANSIILRMTPDGTVIFFNTYAERLFGFTRDEICGKNVVGTIVPEWESTGRNLAGMIHSLVQTPECWSQNENENVTQDGRRVWVSWTNKPIYSPDGKLQELLCVGHDITSRRQAEFERSQLESQLAQAQKMEAIGTLAGGIAHDFNNILSGIMGFAEMTVEEVKDNPVATRYLQRVLAASARARDLVSQILTFSRQEREDPRPVRIDLIAKEVLRLMEAALPSNISIHTAISTDGCVRADPTQVHQILMNLCANAAYAMRDKGGVLSVSLREENGPDGKSWLALTVADTGCGIPAAIQKRIFDPFFTTKPKAEGTGMGLSVVHGIVEKCGGKVEVASEEGKGTAFRILLPLVEEGQLPQAAPEEPQEALRGRERVLFIDDELLLCEMASEGLSLLGYRVTAMQSSELALRRFRETPDAFDVVITDLDMPGLTGDALSQSVLALRPGMPVFVCTGFSQSLTAETARELGLAGLALKPLVVPQLARLIRSAFDRAA